MEMCINAQKSVFDATTAFSYKFAINSPSNAEAYTLNNWPFGNKKQWKHNEPKSDLYTNAQFWKHLKQTATGHFSQQACRKREFNRCEQNASNNKRNTVVMNANATLWSRVNTAHPRRARAAFSSVHQSFDAAPPGGWRTRTPDFIDSPDT